MNRDAARRARRKAFQSDLARAYTDEEASPPEWIDLLTHVRQASAEIRSEIDEETARFAGDGDIRKALGRREHVAARMRARIMDLNAKIHRLNLLAPNDRYTRPMLDAEELLRPLYRTKRTTS